MSFPAALSPEIDAFHAVLGKDGLAAALGFLNARSPYRFTFIYKSEPPLARRILVHDRETLHAVSRELVPISQTYFEFMRTAPTFATRDGLLDELGRLEPGSRPFRGFCGIQLLHADGRHYGWLAHANPGFAVVPHHEIEFLRRVAVSLMRSLETLAVPGS